jgi:DNA invertase Pin-like site-specific DNA recombinase
VSELIPAVAYYRMSTDQQEASVPRQREAVQAWSKVNGYRIIREYVDEGISGDATEKRKDFLRMREDAGTLRDFKAILCWDKDRFGRFDSIEQGYWVKPIRDAGVRLVTVAQGVIDWDSFGGRIVDAALAESKHEFLRSISRNITSGQIRSAKAAYFVGGNVPYAFDRMLVNERGEPQRRILRGQQTDKPKGWHCILVPSENLEELEAVRWIFQTYVEREVSLQTLAAWLNQRDIPGPASKPGKPAKWTRATVHSVLENAHYAGDLVWGEYSSGKYTRVINGEAQAVKGGPRTKSGNPCKTRNTAGLVVVRDAHAAIIDRNLWDRAQAKLQARRATRSSPRAYGYLLSGLLRCGHCGGPMNGSTGHGRLGRKAYRRYVCSNACGRGTCQNHSIREDKLVAALLRKLQNEYLLPERLEALRQKLWEKVRATSRRSPDRADRLRDRVAALDAEIKQGARNLLRAGDNIDLLSEALTALRHQRDQVARELGRAERDQAIPVGEMGEKVDQAIAKLHALRDDLQGIPAERLRPFLRELITRIEVYFEAEPKRQRTHYHFARGVVKLRPQIDASSFGELALRRRRQSTLGDGQDVAVHGRVLDGGSNHASEGRVVWPLAGAERTRQPDHSSHPR